MTRRRASRFWIFGLCGVVLLVGIGGIILHTPPVKRFALAKAAGLLRTRGIALQAASLDYNLLNLSLSLQEVTISSTAAPDLPPLARADQLMIRLDPGAMLSGNLGFKDAAVIRPALHLVIDEGGRDNLPVLPAGGPSRGETGFIIRRLLASEGSLRLEDRMRQIDFHLPSWQLSIAGDPSTREHDLQFNTAQQGRISFEKRTLPLTSLTSHLLLKKNQVEIRTFLLESDGSRIALSGRIDDFGNPVLNLNSDADLRVALFTEIAGLPQEVKGALHLHMMASGPPAQLTVHTKIEGDNLTVEKLENIHLAAESRFVTADRRLHVDLLSIRTPAGSLEARASIALVTKAGESSVRAEINSLDLLRASRLADLPVRIASRASGTVNAHWPGLAYQGAASEARLRLTASQPRPSKNVLPLSALLVANTQGQRVTAVIESIETLAARAQGRVLLASGRQLEGEVRVEVASLAETLQQLDSFRGRTPAPDSSSGVDGSAHIIAALGGTIKQPRATLEVSGSNLQAGDLKGASLTASVLFEPDKVSLKQADLRWREQVMSVRGDVNLAGGSPSLDITARMERASVESILAGLGKPDIPAKGNLTADAQVSGTIQNPSVKASLTGADLYAYNESLGRMAIEACYAGRAVNLTRLRIDQPEGGYLQASGSYNAASKAYTISVEGKRLGFQQWMPVQDVPVRGELNLTASGAGTAEDPNLDIQMAVGNLNVAGHAYGSLNTTLHVAGRHATLEARASEFDLTAAASVGTDDPYPARVDILAKGLDLAKLPINSRAQISGIMTIAVNGFGTLKDWKKGEASASVEARAKWKDLSIRTEAPVRARYAGGVLSVDRSTIAIANSTARLEGKMPLLPSAPPGEFQIQGNLNLADLAALIPNQSLEMNGEVTLDATLRGSLEKIVPIVTVKLANGSFEMRDIDPLSDVSVDAELRDGSVHLDKFSAKWASAIIESSGEIPLGLFTQDLPIDFPRKGGPAHFVLDVKGLDLASIRGVPRKAGGAIALHAEAEVPRSDLDAVTARITFGQLRLNLESIRLEQQGASTIAVRNGVASIERLTLTGPETRLQLSGTTGLRGSRALDLRADGDFDAAILTTFAPSIKAQGPTTLRVTVTGTASEPRASGFVEVRNAQISLVSPKLAAEGLNMRVNLDGDRLTLDRLNGFLNGGEMSMKGGLLYKGRSIEDLDLSMTARGVYLGFPEGLKTVSNADLRLRTVGEDIVVGGQVRIAEGSYREPIALAGGLLGYLRSGELGADLIDEPNPLLSRIRFDLGVESESPLVIDNNLAKAAVNLNLRVVGRYHRPSVTGRIVLGEGGELFFSERVYMVDRGVITLTSEQRIEPALDILARTKAAGYDITLAITGSGGERIETTLTSEPPLPEPDILAILLTGRTLEEIRGSGMNIAREQMLSYLAGGLGGRLSTNLQRATGLTQVRIEPNLIAAESDPSARLTIGQDITRDLRLIYSMNLADSGDQIYITEYDVTKRFTTRGIKQSDNSYRFEFRHDLRFGGAAPIKPASERGAERRIGDVKIQGGGPYFTREQLAKRFKVKPGQKYDFFRVRDGVDRIEKGYARQGLLEARVRLDRDVKASTVDLALDLSAGPQLLFVYEGWDVAGKVREEIKKIWQGGVFDEQKIEEAKTQLRKALIRDGYLESRIEHNITTPGPNTKRVVFEIQPGIRYRDVELVFPGAGSTKASKLAGLIADENLDTAVYSNPGQVVEFLTRYYRDQGYLSAEVQDPKYELDASAGSGRVLIPIREGPRFKVGEVKFTGNRAYEADLLRDAISLRSGIDYHPQLRDDSLKKLQDLYWNKGYDDVEITSSLHRADSGGVVDVNFRIDENKQSVIKGIQIAGNDQTGESLIRSQITVKPGDPLVPEQLSRSRRSLYDTGAYSLVDIEKLPVLDQSTLARPDQQPVDLRVKVREVRPFELRYGAYYDTDRGPGGIVDFANHNTLGNARELGFRARYDFDVREARLYFSQPLLSRFPLKTTATTFVRRDIHDAFLTDSVGFTAQQETRFKKHYIFNYGYRLVRIHTFDKEPDPFLPFDVTLRVAPLTSSFTRETRDDILDATRGSFTSQTFEWAPSFLGSQLRFIRYFGQYFKYLPLSKPAEIPWSSGLQKSRLVYAGAVRAGFAEGLGGQVLVPSERFFAGGGTTIRGFKQDGLGPKDFLGDATGGNAVFIVNNELRFPVLSIFDGVGFVDIGNVYKTVSDFDPTDVRKTAGLGLRVRTPYFLLRFDYGFKLGRRPGESRGQFFFSIGQAF